MWKRGRASGDGVEYERFEEDVARRCAEVEWAVHRWRCEHHMIYFRRMKGGIEFVRVLHERMLPLNHL